MGVSKVSLFSAKQNEIAMYAKLISHPARVAIIDYLLKNDTCINTTFVEELGLAQSTVSQHLKELKDADLIMGEIEGKKICYCINPVKWEVLKTALTSFVMRSVQPKNCC